MDLSLVENASELPLGVISDLGHAVLWLKAIGVVAFIYFIYMVVVAILSYRNIY